MMFDEETQKALLEEFLSENREALGRIEQGLLHLESDPGNREQLNSVFRDMHTVKGNCRMMGFEALEELTHAAETLLDLLREDRLAINQQIGSILLKVLDSVRATLETIHASGSEGEVDFTRQIEALAQIQGQADPESPFHSEADPEGAELDLGSPDDALSSDPTHDETDESSDGGEDMAVDPALPSPPSGTENSGVISQTKLESIRLSIDRLDDLMNQVGELGATFNQLKYTLKNRPDQVDQNLEGMGQLIHQLQGDVLQYRMQPIGRIWDSYHRLVRDLAVDTGKKVLLELVGEETEVDRNVLLSIKDLLGHLIRNAVDHGIESPETRVEKGKSPIGSVVLSAEQKHGQIHLEIRDDGQGINEVKVKEKAIFQGLISPEEAAEMAKPELLKLIMAPGFSTAQEVSKISGRGTGMDVVQAAIDKVGGNLTIFSTPGQGSRFLLRIPQTMAIVPVLLVTGGGETYAAPQSNIVELVSYFGPDIRKHVEGKMQTPMVQVRDKLLPLIPLERALARRGHQRSSSRELERILKKSELHVVILHAEEVHFGLEVVEILEPASLVIKPLNRIFAHVPILSGTAVLADGSVTFLLSVTELIKDLDN
ncbi:MAG: chemotaxis protein CheA [Magnetococcales bacterium]|nr:chemotaxis protein CheA [Magnetococcales bacterium]